MFIIKGEEIKAYELERKIPQLDIDQDSAMGISIFTGGKSTTLSEVGYPRHLFHIVVLLLRLCSSCTLGSFGQRDGRVGLRTKSAGS